MGSARAKATNPVEVAAAAYKEAGRHYAAELMRAALAKVDEEVALLRNIQTLARGDAPGAERVLKDISATLPGTKVLREHLSRSQARILEEVHIRLTPLWYKVALGPSPSAQGRAAAAGRQIATGPIDAEVLREGLKTIGDLLRGDRPPEQG